MRYIGRNTQPFMVFPSLRTELSFTRKSVGVWMFSADFFGPACICGSHAHYCTVSYICFLSTRGVRQTCENVSEDWIVFS